VAVWTISAQEGAGGEQLARRLAHAAGVPLYDRAGLAELAHAARIDVPDVAQLEPGIGSTTAIALSIATGLGSAEAFLELTRRRELPELGRRVVAAAAASACVIQAPAAFAALADHPAAVHARIRAPLARRVEAHAREHMVDRQQAARAVKHDDHTKHAWVSWLYHVDVDDPAAFTLVLDASRLGLDRMVDVLLAAGGRAPRG
jgi:cytidylate kinase